MTTWILQQYDPPQQPRPFDAQAAQLDGLASLSPYSESDAIKCRSLTTYVLTCTRSFAIPAVPCMIAIAILFGPRLRRTALASVAALGVLLVCSACPRDVTAFVWPDGYAFLNDYVYVSGVDLTGANTRKATTVAAYARHTLRRPGPRVIAFADGHVEVIWDERVKPLFQAQGIPYPE